MGFFLHAIVWIWHLNFSGITYQSKLLIWEYELIFLFVRNDADEKERIAEIKIKHTKLYMKLHSIEKHIDAHCTHIFSEFQNLWITDSDPGSHNHMLTIFTCNHNIYKWSKQTKMNGHQRLKTDRQASDEMEECKRVEKMFIQLNCMNLNMI